VMFLFEWSTELIICLLNILKCDFFDVDEAIFLDVERPFERIFYILDIQTYDLDEIAGDDLCRRFALRTHNIPSGRLKKCLCWSRWIDETKFRNAIRSFFSFWASNKVTWLKSLKWCFK
jgi:hypothetical protein